MKLAVQLPRELLVMPEASEVPSKVTAMPTSLVANPEPVMVMEVPGGPLVRLMEIAGSTVKLMVGTLANVVMEP